MPISIVEEFQLNKKAPIDSRLVKANATDRNAIPINYRYDSLRVFQIDERKYYVWNDNTQQWVDDGTGGGSGGSGQSNYIAIWTTPTTIGYSTLYYDQNKLGINTNNPKGSFQIGNASPIVIDGSVNLFGYNAYNETGIMRTFDSTRGSSYFEFDNDKVKLYNRYANTNESYYAQIIRFGLMDYLMQNPSVASTQRNGYLALNTNNIPNNAIVQIGTWETGLAYPMSLSINSNNTSKESFIGLNYKSAFIGDKSSYVDNDPSMAIRFSSIDNRISIIQRASGISSTYITNSYFTLVGAEPYLYLSGTLDVNSDILITLPIPFPQVGDLGYTRSLKSNLALLRSDMNSAKIDITNIYNLISNLPTNSKNIYDIDGTLVSNRTVNLSNYYLNFGDSNTKIRISKAVGDTNGILLSVQTGETLGLRTISSGKYANFSTLALSDNRTYSFRDRDGELALLEDIPVPDWNITNPSTPGYIANKPNFAALLSFYVDVHNPSVGDGSVTNPFNTIDDAINKVIGTGSRNNPTYTNATIKVAGGLYNFDGNLWVRTLTISFDDGATINYKGSGYSIDVPYPVGGTSGGIDQDSSDGVFTTTGKWNWKSTTGGFLRSISKLYSVGIQKGLNIEINNVEDSRPQESSIPSPINYNFNPTILLASRGPIPGDPENGWSTTTLDLKLWGTLISNNRVIVAGQDKVVISITGMSINSAIVSTPFGEGTGPQTNSGHCIWFNNNTNDGRSYIASLTVKNITFGHHNNTAIFLGGRFGSIQFIDIRTGAPSGQAFPIRFMDIENIIMTPYIPQNPGNFIIDHLVLDPKLAYRGENFDSSLNPIGPNWNPGFTECYISVIRSTGGTNNPLNIRNSTFAPIQYGSYIIKPVIMKSGINSSTLTINNQIGAHINLFTHFNVEAIKIFADDTAAIAGGLTQNSIYTTPAGSLRVIL